MTLLAAGDAFPALTLAQSDGQTRALPDLLSGAFGVVLFSRGARCRSCVEQLRAFQRATARLARAGIRVVALTADEEQTTAGLIAEYGLTYPIGHSADVERIAELTGAFVQLDPPALQTTGFVLDPSGRVIVSVYSCGTLGHLLPDEVLELIRDLPSSDADLGAPGAARSGT
jgi:peroxiredoxin